MEKILPEQPKPMNPAVIIHGLMGQVASLQNALTQFQHVSIILMVELLRQSKRIEDNVLVAPGHAALNITGPLAWMVPQQRIDAIEHLFGDDPPVLEFLQEVIDAQPALVVRLVSLSESEARAASKLN